MGRNFAVGQNGFESLGGATAAANSMSSLSVAVYAGD